MERLVFWGFLIITEFQSCEQIIAGTYWITQRPANEIVFAMQFK